MCIFFPSESWLIVYTKGSPKYVIKKYHIIISIIIYSKISNFVLNYYFLKVLNSSESHDPSEIILICWFGAQEAFLIIINVENSCAA